MTTADRILGGGEASEPELGRTARSRRDVESSVPSRGLSRFLFLAGYRARSAVPFFLLAQVAFLVLGIAGALLLARTGWRATLMEWVLEVPGGFGGLFVPILTTAPWITAVLICSIPIVVVRCARRRIVEEVERDLPMLLELLATLGEAGHGLDAAIDLALADEDQERALARELRTFQAEARSGIPRIRCFRQLAARIDVIPASAFVSALVQSEGVGAGLTETLRHQADALWTRRRERALMLAQALPAKLAVPLVVCFLPPLFVFVLGPALLEFFQIAQSTLESGSGR